MTPRLWQLHNYALLLEQACASSILPDQNIPALSVKDVCPTLSKCSPSFHSSTVNACGENSKCDVEKAIPLMIGLFFYKVSFVFVDEFCKCPGNKGCDMEEEFRSIAKQVDLQKAFVIMMTGKPFEQFFRDAVTKEILLPEIGPAMQIIRENENNFLFPFSLRRN